MPNNRNQPHITPSDRTMIAQYLLANSTDGVVNYGKIRSAATSYGVSRRTVHLIWESAKKQIAEGSPVTFLAQKRTVGPKPAELDIEEFKAIPFSKRGSIRRLAKELKASKSQVGRWVKTGVIKPHTNAIKPTLTEANMLQRLKFSLSNLHLDSQVSKIRFNTMHNIVHIDEKWFYMQRATERAYKLEEEEDTYRSCKSKRFITKVMFMCAVSRPQFSAEGDLVFDGKIGIFPFTTTEPALLNSRNRVRGTLVTKPIETVNKQVIGDCLLQQIIPAIKAKWPRNASRQIFIQQDNAKPHISNFDPEFRQAASTDRFDIQLMFQPPNSPDTNILDLGFFRAIQSLQIEIASYNVDDLVKNVITAYEQMEAYKLNNVFLSLQACMTEIMKQKGHNNYKLPHLGKSHLSKEGLLPTTLEVEEEVVRQAIDHLIEKEQAGGSYEIGGLMCALGY